MYACYTDRSRFTTSAPGGPCRGRVIFLHQLSGCRLPNGIRRMWDKVRKWCAWYRMYPYVSHYHTRVIRYHTPSDDYGEGVLNNAHLCVCANLIDEIFPKPPFSLSVPPLPLLELQSHFGDIPVKFQVYCSPKRDCGPKRVKTCFMRNPVLE